MHNESKPPKISDKEAEELAGACRLALGDLSIDHFMDRVFEAPRERRQRREEFGHLWFAE
jgi:hypothetical protein